MSFRFLTLSGFLALVSVSAHASVVLSPGAAPVVLPGSAAFAEPDLAGTVLEDKLLPFIITGAGGALLFDGVLQNRVVKSSSTGLLHFYYRIRDTKPGLNGIVKRVSSVSYAASQRTMADWRPDGLGAVNPTMAQRNAMPGALVRFDFGTSGGVMVGGRESRFFYVKTWAQKYNDAGSTRIELMTGQSVVLKTFAPTN